MNCLGAFSAIEKKLFNKKPVFVRALLININEIVKSQIYRALFFNFLQNQCICLYMLCFKKKKLQYIDIWQSDSTMKYNKK